MSGTMRGKDLAISLLGAIGGGLVGYFGFALAIRQGLYAMVLPGAMLGLGGGLWARDRSALRAVLCGLAALALGLFAEWRFLPFIEDPGLGYFLTHIPQLSGMTLLMIAAGSALGAWLSLGKRRQ
jgi:hypothetical protein